MPLMGCVICPSAWAQGSADQSVEFLETLEIADTVADEEEREISIPKPDASTLMPLSDLMVAAIPRTPRLWPSVRTRTRTEGRIGLAKPDVAPVAPVAGLMVAAISKTPIVPKDGPQLVRDSIADRKGLWQSVRLRTPPAERRISLAAHDTTMLMPFNRLMVGTISKTPVVQQDRPQPTPPRDSIADRKALRKTVRLIKSERPQYPQVARKQGWEGTVVLRINIGAGGDVENVKTQTSSGHAALDESAEQSVKTWRFDPARDGEFRVASVVDLPIRFNLDEYGIQSSREEPEPEPEPEPVKVKKPARLIKSERPDYPQEARKAGWEGTVVLRITIGTGGDVENVTIQESSGFPELDESAAQSVKTWQFDPAKLGDDPISSAVDLPVTFDIEEYGEQEGTTNAE